MKSYRKLAMCMLMMISLSGFAQAQTAQEVIDKVKQKLDKVNDYQAKGKMKTNVAFIKAPIATVKVYYKKPDKLRINNESGISFVPKGSMNINIASLFPTGGSAAFDLIDLGKDSATKLRVIKLIPRDPKSEIRISTLYIDEAQSLVKQAQTNTQNGDYELKITYGKYAEYGLADKIVFSFNTENFKLPKGVTMDYDDGSKKVETEADKERKKKGKVEIIYSNYEINKGIPDSIFQ